MQGQAGVGVNQCQEWIVEEEANEQQTQYSLRTRQMGSWLGRSPGSSGHTQVTRLIRGMLAVKGCLGKSLLEELKLRVSEDNPAYADEIEGSDTDHDPKENALNEGAPTHLAKG